MDRKYKRPTTIGEVRERLMKLGDDSAKLVMIVLGSLAALVVFGILAMLTTRTGGFWHGLWAVLRIVALIVWALSGLLLILSRGRYWVEAAYGFFHAKDKATPPPKELVTEKHRERYTVIDLIGVGRSGYSDDELIEQGKALRPDLFTDEEEW